MLLLKAAVANPFRREEIRCTILVSLFIRAKDTRDNAMIQRYDAGSCRDYEDASHERVFGLLSVCR